MTGLLFVLAIAAMPLLGGIVLILPFVRESGFWGRIGISAITGMTLLGFEMLIYAMLGRAWSLLVLIAPLLLLSLIGFFVARRNGRALSSHPVESALLPSQVVIGAALILVAYVATTAQMSSPDLLFFWGAKGQQFAAMRTIDASFLAAPEHRLMHPDYPPMLPMLFAAATMASGAFSWFGALWTTVLFLAFAVFVFIAFARRAVGELWAVELAAFLSLLLALAYVSTYVGGNADALLIAFETGALASLTFGERSWDADAFASIALAGAVLTKVEALPFVVLSILIFTLGDPAGRRLLRWFRLSLLPGAAIGCWIAYASSHGLLQTYAGRGYGQFTVAHISVVLQTLADSASFGVGYAPWIVVVLFWLASNDRKLGAAHILLAAGLLGFIVFSYLHEASNVVAWISSSASRVLITPLVVLFFAGASGTNSNRAT